MNLQDLKALDAALMAATDSGTLDHLSCCCLHPDTINAFCNAVREAINDYDADLNPEPTHPFTVIYVEPGETNWLFFECSATDSDRAEAQLTDAYPTATALWVNTGHTGERTKPYETCPVCGLLLSETGGSVGTCGRRIATAESDCA